MNSFKIVSLIIFMEKQVNCDRFCKKLYEFGTSFDLIHIYIIYQYCLNSILTITDSFFASTSYVKSEEDNISIFNNVILSFLNILSLGFDSLLVSQLHQILVTHDFCTNKAFLEVSVNGSGCLRSFSKFADSPTSDLVSS